MWRQPIVRTVAADSHGGHEVVAALERHRTWLDEHGGLRQRRGARARGEVEAIALDWLRAELSDLGEGDLLGELAEDVVDREIDPYSAAQKLIDNLRR